LRRNHNPPSVGPLLVATLLIITVAAGPRLALCSYGSARRSADDRTDCSPTTASHGAPDDGSSRSTEKCAAQRILRRYILRRHADDQSD